MRILQVPARFFRLNTAGALHENACDDLEAVCNPMLDLLQQDCLFPDEIVLQTNLLGTDAMVKERIRAYRSAGVTTLRVEPEGQDLRERLTTLEHIVDLVSAANRERVETAP